MTTVGKDMQLWNVGMGQTRFDMSLMGVAKSGRG